MYLCTYVCSILCITVMICAILFTYNDPWYHFVGIVPVYQTRGSYNTSWTGSQDWFLFSYKSAFTSSSYSIPTVDHARMQVSVNHTYVCIMYVCITVIACATTLHRFLLFHLCCFTIYVYIRIYVYFTVSILQYKSLNNVTKYLRWSQPNWGTYVHMHKCVYDIRISKEHCFT